MIVIAAVLTLGIGSYILLSNEVDETKKESAELLKQREVLMGKSKETLEKSRKFLEEGDEAQAQIYCDSTDMYIKAIEEIDKQLDELLN